MAEINLAPFGAEKTNSSEKMYNFGALILSAILISLALPGFIFFSLKRNQAETLYNQSLQQEQELQSEIFALDPEGIEDFQGEIQKLSSLMDEHIYWSWIFPAIEGSTIPAVWYDSMSVSLADSAVSVEANAKNLNGAAKQLRSFKNQKEFQDVQLKDIGSGSEGVVKFSLNFLFSENLVKPNKNKNKEEE